MSVRRKQLTNQNDCFRAALPPPLAEDEEEILSVRRKQLTNQNYCFRAAPPQAEGEGEKESCKGGGREHDRRATHQRKKETTKYNREQIESSSSVGSKRMRQHLGAR